MPIIECTECHGGKETPGDYILDEAGKPICRRCRGRGKIVVERATMVKDDYPEYPTDDDVWARNLQNRFGVKSYYATQKLISMVEELKEAVKDEPESKRLVLHLLKRKGL